MLTVRFATPILKLLFDCHFIDHLRDSRFHDDLDDIARSFDRTTKLRFRNKDEPQYVSFGNGRDTDLEVGIRSGLLKLSGLVLHGLGDMSSANGAFLRADVASFSQPSVTCPTEAILEVHKVTSDVKISVCSDHLTY